MPAELTAPKKLPPKTGPDPDIRAPHIRQKILDQALKSFSERGFDGASMREIAEAVGVRHGLIRYYFGTKDKLWREAVRFMFERQWAALVPSAAESMLPPLKRFELFVRRYIMYSARHPEHARLMIQESTHDNERIAWAARTFIAPGHALMRPNLETLVAEGVLPDVPLEMITYALTGLGQLPFVLLPEIRHTYASDFTDMAAVRRYADAVLKLIVKARPEAQ